LAIVLIGTLYPLGVEAITGEKLSVGAPYFNLATVPIALALTVAMAAGPVMRWRRDGIGALVSRTAVPLLVTAASLLLLVIFAPGIGLMSLLGLALAAGLAVASFAPLWGRNLRRTPLYIFGTVIAHFGIAVAIVGMASESSFTIEKLVAAKPGDSVKVGDWTVAFQAIEPVAGPNWTALEGRMTASYAGGAATIISPQNRVFSDAQQTPTSEAALITRWNGQLYIVIGDATEDGRWQLRLWWKPFVTLIWYGGLLIAFGGLLALFGRVARGLRQRFGRRQAELLA
jgi:cytochrome c-type biogenesis protein CcmF